ncbi:30S ribosomal protein S17 [Candidatus Woesearchaeota archaeon]|nr:30S ribosomal protein S17 [Candidatus Woesearchaeota archaeon]
MVMKKQTTQTNCEDKHCSVHSNLSIRGRSFMGTVTKSKMYRTASVEWQIWKYIPKYERYEKRRTRINAHNPDCINANRGDVVIIKECRPISKTKHFIIVEKHEKDIAFLEKEEAKDILKHVGGKNEAIES